MYIFLIVLIIVLIGIIMYMQFSKNKPPKKDDEKEKLIEVITDNITAKGTDEKFEIEVKGSQGNYIYLVENGIIMGVFNKNSNRYYEYIRR